VISAENNRKKTITEENKAVTGGYILNAFSDIRLKTYVMLLAAIGMRAIINPY
jgi:hypothetical protein